MPQKHSGIIPENSSSYNFGKKGDSKFSQLRIPLSQRAAAATNGMLRTDKARIGLEGTVVGFCGGSSIHVLPTI